MEDCNTLISDCIIISCCCQCLLLQLVVFMFLQLPLRVARKTKEYAKRKLWNTRKKKKKKKKKKNQQQDDEQKVEEYDNYNSDDKSGKSMSLRLLELEGMAVNELHKWGTCMEEVDKVFEDLSFKGQFGFGSFWGTNFVNNHQINHTLNNNNNNTNNNNNNNNKCYCKCNRRLTKEDELDFGSHVVKFHLIEIIGRFS
ncbi:uncharacterized protein [Spinacia oleracea]|uniref:Uncharacterized protein n=1 Tax=Spinacia oleracea TaxID=3562 RepID=A0A9R0JTL8_SPIOL|nr:uncharacterized protein LOC110786328 [Spinacia oleracea]